ncbi:MAG TPA: VCBS repeat-containing protein, partial [bacterium]|nr:VCBS repeat-containing protein [bacterium]
LDQVFGVELADIDGDGDLDLVSAARDAFKVSWWENTAGDGSSWTETVVDPAFFEATSISCADIDGDGDMDIAGCAYGSNEIRWWKNTAGDGSSWSMDSIDDDFDDGRHVECYDMDGDGDMDIIGVSASLGFFVYRNATGTGSSWSKVTIYSHAGQCSWVDAGDVDGDGDMDVVGVTSGTDDVLVFKNTNGIGTTWSSSIISGNEDSALSVTTGDLDRDGDQDIVVAASGSEELIWFENSGNGSSWTRHLIGSSLYGSRHGRIVDMDRDGDPDILQCSTFDQDIIWWENTGGDASAWTKRTVESSYYMVMYVCSGDIDGDGDLDVGACSPFGETIVWYRNELIHRSARYPESMLISDTVLRNCYQTLPGDIDRDGDIDFVSLNQYSDTLSWFENTAGNASAWTENIIEDPLNAPNSGKLIDMDTDGDLDIVVATYGESDISWWENSSNGASWTRHEITASTFGNAKGVDVADVDGDGDLDVVGSAWAFDDIAWFENTNGSGTSWTKYFLHTEYARPECVGAADLDNDGDIDIFSGSRDDGTVNWWENIIGSGTTWSFHTITDDFSAPYRVSAVDMDRDGDLDIVTGSISANRFSWWENDGSGGTWSEHSISNDRTRAYTIADLDFDGDLDVVLGNYSTDTVKIIENIDGAGTLWNEGAPSEDMDTIYGVAVFDADHEGDPDLVAGTRSGIYFFANRGGQFALPTNDIAPSTALEGTYAGALQIDFEHRGRDGDFDEELGTFDLLLTDDAGTPLSSAQANALIENLHIYLDTGNGVFDLGLDTEISVVQDLNLDPEGRQTITFSAGNPDTRIMHNEVKVFFVVPEIAVGAASQTPAAFKIGHDTANSSTAWDAANDLPLSL